MSYLEEVLTKKPEAQTSVEQSSYLDRLLGRIKKPFETAYEKPEETLMGGLGMATLGAPQITQFAMEKATGQKAPINAISGFANALELQNTLTAPVSTAAMLGAEEAGAPFPIPLAAGLATGAGEAAIVGKVGAYLTGTRELATAIGAKEGASLTAEAEDLLARVAAGDKSALAKASKDLRLDGADASYLKKLPPEVQANVLRKLNAYGIEELKTTPEKALEHAAALFKGGEPTAVRPTVLEAAAESERIGLADALKQSIKNADFVEKPAKVDAFVNKAPSDVLGIVKEDLSQLTPTAQAAYADKVSNLVFQAREPSVIRSLVEAKRGAMLLGIGGRIRDIMSTTANILYNVPRVVVAGAVDAALPSATGAPRERYVGEALGYVYGMIHGIPDALKQLAIERRAMREWTADSSEIARYLESVKANPTVTKLAGQAATVPGRLVSAVDTLLYSPEMSGQMYRQAYRQAAREGISGSLSRLKRANTIVADWAGQAPAKVSSAYRIANAVLSQRGTPSQAEIAEVAKGIIRNESQAIAGNAGRLAERSIFVANEGKKLDKALQAYQYLRSVPYIGTILDMAVPFVPTISRISREFFRDTPVQLLHSAGDAVSYYKRGSALELAFDQLNNLNPEGIGNLQRLASLDASEVAQFVDSMQIAAKTGVNPKIGDMARQFLSSNPGRFNDVVRQDMVDFASRGLMGLGVTATLWHLMDAGQIKVQSFGDKQRPQRLTEEAAGIFQDSLQIGGWSIPLKSLGPMSSHLLAINRARGLYQSYQKTGDEGTLKQVLDNVQAATGGIFEGLASADFADNLANFLHAYKSKDSQAENYWAALGASFSPALLREYRRVIKQEPMREHITSLPEENSAKQIDNALAGLRSELLGTGKPVLGAFGMERKANPGGIGGSALTFIFGKAGYGSDDPYLTHLASTGIWVDRPSEVLTQGGQKIQLGDDESYDLAKARGALQYYYGRRLFQNPAYTQLSAEQKTVAMKKTLSGASEIVSNRARALKNNKKVLTQADLLRGLL